MVVLICVIFRGHPLSRCKANTPKGDIPFKQMDEQQKMPLLYGFIEKLSPKIIYTFLAFPMNFFGFDYMVICIGLLYQQKNGM